MKAVSRHVTVVDDDDALRAVLIQVLEEKGYVVRAFSCPLEFQANAGEISEGALLLDMRMPGLTGGELHAWLKARGYERPIVFISGQSMAFEIVEAWRQEAVDFLLKPFSLAQLFNAVQKALEVDARRRWRAAHERKLRLLWAGLTRREREVCHLMTKGYANREIAALHGSLPATVKLHRSRVLEKMMVDSLPSLVRVFDGIDISHWIETEN